MNKGLIYIIGGLIIGGLAGFSYWFFIGCDTGTCAITSQWSTSTLYGLGMGGLGGAIVKDGFTGKKGDGGGSEAESGTPEGKF